jgi:hypothetical protein
MRDGVVASAKTLPEVPMSVADPCAPVYTVFRAFVLRGKRTTGLMLEADSQEELDARLAEMRRREPFDRRKVEYHKVTLRRRLLGSPDCDEVIGDEVYRYRSSSPAVPVAP